MESQVKLVLEGPIAGIVLVGDLTHASEQKMLHVYEKIAAARAKYILLDFQQV